MAVITIYIVHFQKLSRLKKTIRHIKEHTSVSFIVRILNQGYINSDIENYLECLNRRDNFEVIYYPVNVGPAPGRKILFQDIGSKFVLSLDDDIYLPPKWFEDIHIFLDNNDEVGVVGLALKDPSGNRISTAKTIEIRGDNVLHTKDYFIPPNAKKISDQFYFVDYVSEGAMILRERVAKQLIWDQKLTVCFEGLDAGLQFRDMGEKVVVYTGKVAVHDSISKNREFRSYNLSRRDYREIRRNYLRLTNKWHIRFPWAKHFFYLYVAYILPRSWLRNLAYIWLNILKPSIRGINLLGNQRQDV